MDIETVFTVREEVKQDLLSATGGLSRVPLAFEGTAKTSSRKPFAQATFVVKLVGMESGHWRWSVALDGNSIFAFDMSTMRVPVQRVLSVFTTGQAAIFFVVIQPMFSVCEDLIKIRLEGAGAHTLHVENKPKEGATTRLRLQRENRVTLLKEHAEAFARICRTRTMQSMD